MNETDIPINIELGEHGLYYGTSPAMKGLLVTGESVKQVMDKVPSAIAEMRAATEISALRSQLEEAKDLAELFEMLCKQLIRDERINNFEELHGLAARARSFLKENGNG